MVYGRIMIGITASPSYKMQGDMTKHDPYANRAGKWFEQINLETNEIRSTYYTTEESRLDRFPQAGTDTTRPQSRRVDFPAENAAVRVATTLGLKWTTADRWTS